MPWRAIGISLRNQANGSEHVEHLAPRTVLKLPQYDTRRPQWDQMISVTSEPRIEYMGLSPTKLANA